MLVLSRQRDESIVIGDNIVIHDCPIFAAISCDWESMPRPKFRCIGRRSTTPSSAKTCAPAGSSRAIRRPWEKPSGDQPQAPRGGKG